MKEDELAFLRSVEQLTQRLLLRLETGYSGRDEAGAIKLALNQRIIALLEERQEAELVERYS